MAYSRGKIESKPPLWAPGLNTSHPLAEGLVLALPFWGKSGTRVMDVSGYGLHGTLTNGADSTWSSGPDSLHFDYNDDLVNCGTSSILDADNLPTTHAVMFNADVLQTTQYLITKGNPVWMLWLSTTRLCFWHGGTTQLNRKSKSSRLTAGVWHIAVMTWDGSVNWSGVRLFLVPGGTVVKDDNAIEVDYDAAQNQDAVSPTSDSGQAFTVGNRSDGARPFDGRIAMVLRWNRILADGEIRHLIEDPWALMAPPIRLPQWVAAMGTFTGYRLYRGIGGLGTVDFDTIIDTAGPSDTSIETVAAGHAASTRYTYVLRPVIAGLESPDHSCKTEFVTDSGADWIGARPGPVEYLTARVLSGGQIELRWRYLTPYGGTAPASFYIYHGSGPNLTADGSPDATENYTRDGGYTKTLTLSDATTYYFVITARSSGGVESKLSDEIGPYVADSSGPATPVGYVSAAW